MRLRVSDERKRAKEFFKKENGKIVSNLATTKRY